MEECKGSMHSSSGSSSLFLHNSGLQSGASLVRTMLAEAGSGLNGPPSTLNSRRFDESVATVNASPNGLTMNQISP